MKDLIGQLLGRTSEHESDHPIPIADLARWLATHIEDLRQLPSAAEAFDEISAIIATIRADTDRPPSRRYAGRCKCGEDLYADPGPMVACGNCGSSYDVAQRQKDMLAAAKDYLATPTEISRAVMTLSGQHLTRDMIKGYIQRKRLTAKSHTKDGKALYRVGDVVALIEETRRVNAS